MCPEIKWNSQGLTFLWIREKVYVIENKENWQFPMWEMCLDDNIGDVAESGGSC
jgi:hypothetical protein